MTMPKDPYEELRAMQEDQLVDLIRDTVVRLEALGDRLEQYATAKSAIQVGFEVEEPGDNHEGQSDTQS